MEAVQRSANIPSDQTLRWLLNIETGELTASEAQTVRSMLQQATTQVHAEVRYDSNVPEVQVTPQTCVLSWCARREAQRAR